MHVSWQTVNRPVTKLRTAGFTTALITSLLLPILAGPSIAHATICGITCTYSDTWGTQEVASTSWLTAIGGGVPIYSNGPSAPGGPTPDTYNYINNSNGINTQTGIKWQCVELVNRLYLTKGWTTSTWSGNGNQLYANAPSSLIKQANGTVTNLAVGDVLSMSNGSGFGHGAVVNSVSGSAIGIASQNTNAVYDTTSFTINNGTISTSWFNYSVIGVIHHPGGGVIPPTFKMTSSTEDAPMAGDLNGDGNGDVIMADKHANDNGVDLHVLFGANGQPFQYTPTLVRTFAAPTWDINRMKFVVGRFNSDQYADLAVFYRQDDGISTSVYIFYGAPGPGLPLQSNDPPQHYLLASDGWNWNTMKLVSGDVNGDGYDDVVVAAKLSSGGAGFHVLTGGVGSAALNNQDVNTSWRDLPAPAWYYDNMKLAVGPFNADNAADVAIVYNNAGINIHILNGGAEKFTNASTLLQTLPSGSGWNWNLVKLAAGQYNDDVYADLVLLHKDTDGGMAAHTFYGSGLGAAPFSSSWLPARTLTGTPGDGWSWDNVKLESGPVQMDNWSDIILLHRNNTQDIDAHVLYGNPGNLMFNYNPTFVKEFTQAQGYNWSLMTPA